MGTKNYRHNSSLLKAFTPTPNRKLGEGFKTTKGLLVWGFTLVELLIVVSIIMILAVITMMYFRQQLLKGNDARRKADMNRIKVAVEEYEKDHNCYPATVSCGVDVNQPVYPYLNDVPCDPTTNSSYGYDYQAGACPGWFRLFTGLQNSNDSAIISNIGPGGSYNYYLGSDNAPSLGNPGGGNPGGSNGGVVSNGNTGYWACINGSCQPILIINGRPSCDPSFQRGDCNSQCNTAPNCTPVQ